MEENGHEQFNVKLAVECAQAFAVTAKLGCVVTDDGETVFFQTGYCAASCNLCAAAEVAGNRETEKSDCSALHIYGMRQAERFGGKYIYCCKMGLTFFVSPIMEGESGTAKITVGPFLMVDVDDYVLFELEHSRHLNAQQIEQVKKVLCLIPFVSPERVNSMASLLFMAVGFLNKVEVSNRALENKDSADIQGHISDFIARLKTDSGAVGYPFGKEQELLQSIIDSDHSRAQKLLNELLGHIFFASGNNFEQIRARVYELLVLISRAAIEGGADPDNSFMLNRRFLRQVHTLKNIEELCFWLSGVINQFTNTVFRFTDVKHIDVIQKAVQHIRKNYAQKLSLEETAAAASLSPSYFSKVFKQEMKCNFNTYLNTVRIEKCKQMLLLESIKLLDIAFLAGFEDQSYFTKVFKKITGVSPTKFREAKGRIKK